MTTSPTVSTFGISLSSSSKLSSVHLEQHSSKVYHSEPYHPLFGLRDADVVLRSNEGTLYRVHSYTLRMNSGLFDTMFSLPQPKNPVNFTSSTGLNPGPLDIYEDDIVVEPLLKVVYGLPIDPWQTLDDLERALNVAEKWDTPGPISHFRLALSGFTEAHPLRCYALAKNFGWTEEAKLASRYTLTMDLRNPAYTSILNSMYSKDVSALVNLHKRRRDKFRDLLNSPERFTAGNISPYHCHTCGVTELDNYTWCQLKNRMFSEMERRPLGDTLDLTSSDTVKWPESLACWEAKCKKPGCGGLNYDRVSTLRQIRACIDVLPSTIDD